MAGHFSYPMLSSLIDAIQQNCVLSDARDNGIYSMCTLFLRLRNLYKWEHGKLPWQEEEPAILMEWIEQKEKLWLGLLDAPFLRLPVGEETADPDDIELVNAFLARQNTGLLYGAGHGRSLKSIFFLAEIKETRRLATHPVQVLDREHCRELSSPFAMHQDGVIYFRLDPFRYFLWDKIQEAAGAKAMATRYALAKYGLIDSGGKIINEKLRHHFEKIVLAEMEAILFHELGELSPSPLSGQVLAELINAFPDSPVELIARATKDILADTADGGMLQHIIEEEKFSSLGFYAAMLDGMRRELFCEFKSAFEDFIAREDWQVIDRVRKSSYLKNLARAELLSSFSARLTETPAAQLIQEIEQEVLFPLGLTSPQQGTNNE
ncbi:MAG: hypothetical protein P8130_03060 [Deltaproteobacteria bacterium]